MFSKRHGICGNTKSHVKCKLKTKRFKCFKVQCFFVLLLFLEQQALDSQPLTDSNIYMFNYFVIFIVLGVFVCANLIVGILVKQILVAGNLSGVFGSSKKSSNLGLNGSNGLNSGESAQDVSVIILKTFLHF